MTETEKTYRTQRTLLIILTVVSFIWVLAVLLWGWKYAPGYQPLSSNVSPASTPADLGELTTRVELLEKIHNQNLKAFEWQLDQKLFVISLVALFISFVSGFIGIKSYNDLDRLIMERVNATLAKELYQRDVSNQKIWLYTDEKSAAEMEAIVTRLELSGLTYVESIENLDKRSYRGITIVPVFDADMDKRLADYLVRNKKRLNSLKAAFVLYTKSYRVQDETFEQFTNIVPANMPVTVVSHIFTVARGLVDDINTHNKEHE